MPLIVSPEIYDERLDPEAPVDAELVSRVQLASEALSLTVSSVA